MFYDFHTNICLTTMILAAWFSCCGGIRSILRKRGRRFVFLLY